MEPERSTPATSAHPEAAGPPQPAALLSAPQVEPPGQSMVSPRQAETLAGWIKEDLAAGKLTPEQADKAFAELNTPPEQRAPDTRTDEQKMHDQHFPAAKPEEYRIAYGDPGQEPPPMTPEMTQFDTAARTWMSEAGFPRDLGNSLTHAIGAVTRATAGKTEAELDLYGQTEYTKLERIYKNTLGEKLQQAGAMIDVLDRKQPGLKALLQSHGIGDNALVVSLLIQQAERFHWRKR